MKKRAAFIFVLLAIFSVLSSLPIISSLDFDVHANYSLGETIIVKLAGNFITPLTASNVLFYKGHVRIPMQYDLIQVEEDYYIYAVLVGKSEGNYSISVENARYMEGTEVIKDKIIKNFSITNQTADFSVNPGSLFASGDFSIEVQNLQANATTINIKTSGGVSGEREILIPSANSTQTSFSLASGAKKTITFSPGVGNKTLRFIEIKNQNLIYKIPAYLGEILEGKQKSTFVLEPSSLIYSFVNGSVIKKAIYLYNTGDSDITNINLSLDKDLAPFVNLSVTKISKLSANSKITIELTFFSKKEISVLGNILAKTGDSIAYSSLTLRFIDNSTTTPIVIINQTNYTNYLDNETSKINGTNYTANVTVITPNGTIQSSQKTCAQLMGTICPSEQECSQEVIHAKDNLCCLATCQEIKKSNSGIFVAVVIILVIFLIGIWFFVKFKRTKNSPINLLNVARGRN